MMQLEVLKSANKSYIFKGLYNIITYSIIISNVGDKVINNIRMRDILSEEVCFLKGTFKINGRKLNVNNVVNYINIGSLSAGNNAIITFDVEVNKNIPVNNVINEAIVSYCDEMGKYKSIKSNKLILKVINMNVCAQKQSDKEIVPIGGIISYIVTLTNSSNINIDDVVFYDDLSSNVDLLPGSVYINSISNNIESLSDGIDLGTIQSNSSVIIQFQVKVISMPTSGFIYNVGIFEYTYSFDDNGMNISSIGESHTNRVITKVENRILTC